MKARERIEAYLKLAESATEGPWYWLNNQALIAGHGNRPAILTSASHNRMSYLAEATPDGLLQHIDPKGANARFLASSRTEGVWAARALLMALTHIENLTSGTQTRFMFENNCDAARAFLKELNDE